MSDFRARIVAELDPSRIPSQLQKISRDNTLVLSKIRLDTTGLPSQIQASLDNHRFTISLDGIKMANIDSQMQNAGKTAGQSFSQALLNRINTQLNNGGIESSIAKVKAQYEQLGTTGHSKLSIVEQDLRELGRLQAAMSNSADSTTLVTNYTEYNKVLTRVRNSLSTISSQSKTFTNFFSPTVDVSQINSLDSKIASWLQKNSKATNDFGAGIQKLRQRLSELDGSCEDAKTKLDAIEQEFKEIKNQAALAGKTGKAFGSQLTAAFNSIWRYVGVSTIISQIIIAFKQMYQSVYDINTAMTELKKVTNETDEAYDTFLDNAGKKAQKLGTTISELVNSTADFARLGYSLSDSESLAEVANIYSVVGDEVKDIDAATQSIISTMTAFKIEANDAMSIVDKFNAVGNNFAISSGNIGEALQRSASSLAAANNSLSQSIALITAANKNW